MYKTKYDLINCNDKLIKHAYYNICYKIYIIKYNNSLNILIIHS